MRLRRCCFAMVSGLTFFQSLFACAPPNAGGSPSAMRDTPGAYVVVAESRFMAESFRLDFPRRWSVVKASPADAEFLRVVFVAPDGGTVSLSQVARAESAGGDYMILDSGDVIEVAIAPGPDPSPQFAAQSRALVSSIRS